MGFSIVMGCHGGSPLSLDYGMDGMDAVSKEPGDGLAQSGAQGKRAKSARKADKKAVEQLYIYIHINRLFFYSLVASNMIHFEHFQSIFGMMSFHDQHLFDAFKLPIRVYIPAKSQLRLATFVTEFDTTSFLIVFQKATSTS